MSRLIKIIDENTIEIAEYRNPEVIFKSSENPPTLQNIKDEIEHLEWYCTFKTTINPFQMYAENEILHSIIKEVREYIEKLLKEETEITDEDNIDYGMKCQRAYFSDSELGKILEILEKE